MDRLRGRTPLTVTFDTNTLRSVVSPENAQRATGPSGTAVKRSIQAGEIQGFFSETLVTLEGMQRADRRRVLSPTEIAGKATQTGKNTISIKVGARHLR